MGCDDDIERLKKMRCYRTIRCSTPSALSVSERCLPPDFFHNRYNGVEKVLQNAFLELSECAEVLSSYILAKFFEDNGNRSNE